MQRAASLPLQPIGLGDVASKFSAFAKHDFKTLPAPHELEKCSGQRILDRED
jgi:hypothetical protein